MGEEGELAHPYVVFDDYRTTEPSSDSAGMERAVAPEECIGIERSAVWETQGVADRLLDRFLDRPNLEERPDPLWPIRGMGYLP